MCVVEFIIYFKHKTAYDVRMSDWISDVCSSDHALSLDGPPASSTQVSTSRPWRDAGTRSWHKTARRRSASPASILPNGRFDRTQPGNERPEIGRASCRERGCPYVTISVAAVTVNNNKTPISIALY